MQNEKRILSPLLYYLLVASLTDLIFIAFGTLVFIFGSPPSNIDTIIIVIIFFVFLLKSLIVGFATYLAHKQGRFNKVSGASFVGLYFGQFFGLIIGAFIGWQIAKGIGAIVGALLFYFAGRWTGSNVGFFIGRILDRNLPVADISEKVIPKPFLSKKLLIIVYVAIFPLLWVLLALFFKFNDIQFADLPTNWLPKVRLIVIAISLFSIIAPWIIQKRMLQNHISNSMFNVFWLGLVLSVIPVVYGFFLFAMGASIIELGVFAVISSLAAAIWGIKSGAEDQKAG